MGSVTSPPGYKCRAVSYQLKDLITRCAYEFDDVRMTEFSQQFQLPDVHLAEIAPELGYSDLATTQFPNVDVFETSTADTFHFHQLLGLDDRVFQSKLSKIKVKLRVTSSPYLVREWRGRRVGGVNVIAQEHRCGLARYMLVACHSVKDSLGF